MKTIIAIYLTLLPTIALLAQSPTILPSSPTSNSQTTNTNSTPKSPLSPKAPTTPLPPVTPSSPTMSTSSPKKTPSPKTSSKDSIVQSKPAVTDSSISSTPSKAQKTPSQSLTKIEKKDISDNPKRLMSHQLKLSFHYMDFSYNEPNVMKEDGQFPGIGLNYEFTLRNIIAISTNFSYLKGTIDYDGALDSGAPYKTTARDSIFKASIHIGKPFHLSPISFTPFIGIGYRRWIDDLSKDPYGYKRKTEYLFIPAGLKTNYQINSHVNLTLIGQYNYLLKGNNTSYMSKLGNLPIIIESVPAIEVNRDLKFKQKKGDGYFLALTASIKLPYRFLLNITSYYQRWNIKKSTNDYIYSYTSDSVYSEPINEPKNNTQEIGVSIEVCHILW